MTEIGQNFKYPEYLVDTHWLEQQLGVPELRIFDCTVNVGPNPDLELSKKIPFVFRSGRSQYEKAHIPGAGFIDVPNDLSAPDSTLPLMLPSEQQFSEVMGKNGVGEGTRVVLYSATEQNWATRVWWMLRAFGFKDVTVLDGGWAKWTSEGRPLSDQPCSYESSKFSIRERPDAFVSKDEVLAAINSNNACIISALPRPVFEGSSDVVFGRKGRIAGSVNVPFAALHDPLIGNYLSAGFIRKQFEAVGVNEAERIITYCGGGIAASNAAFVLTMLGYDNVAVYDGSMLEWGNDASLPMDAG